MARIVYKKRFEGLDYLECIEGIEITFDNVRKALIFPKYADCKMLDRNFDLEDWDSEEMTIKQAMKSDGGADNEELYRISSPAEMFVCGFKTDKWGMRDLPDLRLAVEIQKQRMEIDRQAEKIVGADLLSENRGGIWSCARASGDSCYIALSDESIFSDIVCDKHVCVPCVLNYTE
uniref:hypothetical protein n=1 Tax=Candidatus Cryptobacteroides bacterium TaxID=3085639 RepID=UPI004026A6AF